MLDSPAALAWVANYGAIELHPWTSTVARRQPTDVGDDRHRPRHRQLVRRRARPRPPAPHRPRPPRRAGDAEGDRQAWHPDLGAGRRPLHVRRHPRRGSRRCRGPSAPPCPTSSAGSGRCRSAADAPGSTTRRTRSTRRSSPRSARGRSPARRCRCRSPGTSSTTPTCAPTAGRSRNVGERLATTAIRWPPDRPAATASTALTSMVGENPCRIDGSVDRGRYEP